MKEQMNNCPIVLYTAPDGTTQLDIKLENETVWLNISQMSVLFGKEASNIRRHVLNVFKEEELERGSNVHSLHVPFSDKPVPFTKHYYLFKPL